MSFHFQKSLFFLLFFSLSAILDRGIYAEDSLISPELAVKDEKDPFLWYSLVDIGLEGKGWVEPEDPYIRLPLRAKEKVRSVVWRLSTDSSGVSARFVTNARTLRAKWTLKSNRSMPHMPSTGVSGVDLYVRLDDGSWRWVTNGKPKGLENEATLFSNIPEGEREFRIYLPLYNGVNSVSIGIPEGSQIKKAPAYEGAKQKPIVFYGTSITHGACASRPGMTHTSMINRRFDWPVINLGFSGNGRMELEVAEFINEIDAAVYVIDCLPNLNHEQVKNRTIPLVNKIREKHPETPILLVEDRNYSNGFLIQSFRDRNLSSQKELKAAYEKLIADGDKNLYYLEGIKLLGSDGDGTVDNSHPNDLGFYRQANAFEEALRPILFPEK